MKARTIISGRTARPQIPLSKQIYKFLDTNGDGSGTKSAIGDYSSTPGIFFKQPKVGQTFIIQRMVVHIDGSGAPRNDRYGFDIDLSTGTGVEVRVQNDSGTVLDLLDGSPIKTNADWGHFNYDINDPALLGGGTRSFLVRWTFTNAGFGLMINGNNNERFEVKLNDNLTGLIDHRFMIHGYIL